MEVIRWLSIADRYMKMYLDKELAVLGLNSSQHMYVVKVCQQPGITQDQFFAQFYVNPSNITRALAYLEVAGFVRKEENPFDKRTCRLYPTQKALDTREKIEMIIEQGEQRLLEDMSAEEIKSFKHGIEHIAKRAISL